jgi:hypothetical protein
MISHAIFAAGRGGDVSTVHHWVRAVESGDIFAAGRGGDGSTAHHWVRAVESDDIEGGGVASGWAGAGA